MSWANQVLQYPLATWRGLRRVWPRIADRVAMRTARLSSPATAFVSQPEPRSYGQAAHGVQMLAGNYLVRGNIHEMPDSVPWDIVSLGHDQRVQMHGFAWLDDVVAVDTPEARAKAQAWVFEWVERYGRGRGDGWVPDLAGRRVVRWINHAILILQRADSEQSQAFFRSLGHQAHFLRKRWKSVRAGLPRFEALTGLAYCGLALEGQGHVLQPALKALGRECVREIGADGGIASRNPEELMEIFTLLSWVNQAVSVHGQAIDSEILLALERIAPAIRALRLGDGRMVQFHGGAAGQADRVDQALADAGIRSPARMGGAMGYSRMSASGTVLVVDTANMPSSEHSQNVHAGALSFEMSSGRVPILVNMGPARGYATQIRNASRASAAHNVSVLDRVSSARFIGKDKRLRWVAAPSFVNAKKDDNEFGQALLARHDGYSQSHGLIHERQLAVVHSGEEVQGEERFYCKSTGERVRFGARADENRAMPFETHFRFHPDVDVELGLNGTIASIQLKTGEIWLLRAKDGDLELRDTIFIEQGRLKPRATQEVVVMGRVVDYEGGISWTLTRSS
ncbi:MAG: heparinase II/III family protein [Amylibacter sp.]|jgi:uncharacterized heparinase superfamily protein|nr:heparinase II/III family protein [Amylibacter sp.]